MRATVQGAGQAEEGEGGGCGRKTHQVGENANAQ